MTNEISSLRRPNDAFTPGIEVEKARQSGEGESLAWRVTDAGDRLGWPRWLRGHSDTATQVDWPADPTRTATSDGIWWVSFGEQRADNGDWIIMEPSGKLHVAQVKI